MLRGKRMRQLKKLYLQNPVFKFMVSYTVVLILPLILCLAGYRVAFNIVEGEIKDNKLAMINHSKSLIDNQIEGLNTLVLQIATSPTMLSLVETDSIKAGTFFWDAKKAIERTSQLFTHSSNNMIEDIYIYLHNTEYVITPETLYNARFYHEKILKYKDISYKQWQEGLLGNTREDDYIITDKEVSYIQTLPLKYNASTQGAVVCELKRSEIQKFFKSVDPGDGSIIFVQDSKDHLVWHSTSKEEILNYIDVVNKYQGEGIFSTTINNKKMIVLYTISDVNGWRYVLLLPEHVVMADLFHLRNTVTMLLVIILGGGILISYYLSVKNGRPLSDIMNQLKGLDVEQEIWDKELGNIDDLGGAITKMVARTQTLRKEIDKQQPLLQTAFWQKVIRGEFTDEDEMKLFANRANIILEDTPQRVVACRVFANNDFYSMDIQTLEEVNIAILIIKNILKELLEEKVYFYDVDYLTTVAIINDEKDEVNLIEQKVKEANAYMIANYYITPVWGISNLCHSWLEIWRAYEQAKGALKSGVKEGLKNIIFYKDVIEERVTYYYPLDFEERLIHYCKRADKVSIQSLLSILYTENFINRKLSGYTVQKLYDELNSTIVKIIGTDTEIEGADKLERFNDPKDAKLYFKVLLDICLSISRRYKEAKNNSQVDLIQKIKDYIQEVYKDPNLCLGMVSSHFNISEGYISTLFKEQTGVNFTEYVEELRMNRACGLLKDTKLNINDIGEQVGYNSVQSFRRAFKRIHGISPSELRK